MQSEEEPPQNEESALVDYNKNLIKAYFSKAKVTCIFICVIWVMFVVQCIMTWIYPGQSYGFRLINPYVLIKLGGNVPVLVKSGQVYRLFTATILHAGILHIFMNTVSLIVFCALVEAAFTTHLYFAIYVIGGIQGNMLFDLYNLKIRGQASVAIGASTSICAIMGLYIAQVIILYQKKEDIKQAKRSVISMLISLVVISLMPGVDLLGHFGSLFSGLFLGMMLLPGSDVEVSKVKKIGIGSFIGYTMILLTMFI